MTPEQVPIRDYSLPPEGLRQTPESVDLELTGMCNLSCRYCFYANQMQNKRDLNTEAWYSIISELGDLAVRKATLSGGEVFIRNDIFNIIDSLIKNRMRYNILTNGTLITNDTIEHLNEGKRRLRLDSIQVSIDGSCAKIHDLSRPPNSFERAIRGIRLLKEAELPATVRVTLNRHNVDDLDGIAHLLIDDIGLPGFSTNEVAPMGTAQCHGENILLSHEQRKTAMKKLIELNNQYNGRISAQAGPLAMAHIIDEIDRLREMGAKKQKGKGALISCGCVFSKMAILHDGTMVPCSMLPSLIMGVAGMHSIRNAWLHSPAINAVRYRKDVPLSSLPSCSNCAYTGFCVGGCPAVPMAMNGNLLAIDPLFCYRYYKGEVEFDDLM